MFDRIFYINLDRRPDRNDNVRQLLKTHNLERISTRIPAVDGSKLNLNDVPKNIITQKGIDDAKNRHERVGIPLTVGAIGCAMSHRNAWRRIIDLNIGSALILEDDIRIDPEFHQKMRKYKHHVPKNYDVIFIGYHPATVVYMDHSNPVNQIFLRTKKVYGLFGYIVSRKGAEKLLKMFPITQQIDTEMYRAIPTLGLDMYLVKPVHRVITSDPSEISHQFGTDIQKRENFSDQLDSDSMDSRQTLSLFLKFMVIFLIIWLIHKLAIK
jgi:glycosyl transferase family 25